MTFWELEHTADVKVRVVAASLEELYSEAARALMSVIYGRPGDNGVAREIVVLAHDAESLVHTFLSELLYITDVEGLVISRADLSITENELRGTLFGEPFSPAKHSGGREVKGISYSGLSLRHEHGSYILDVIFDV